MAKGKKATPKSQVTGVNQQKQLKDKLRVAAKNIADLKKEFKAKLAVVQTTAYGKGYSEAIKQANQKVRAKTQAVVNLEQSFEKEFAKLVAANAPKTAAKGKKVTKAKKTTKANVVNKAKDGVKAIKKTMRNTGKSMKRAAADKKVNASSAEQGYEAAVSTVAE